MPASGSQPPRPAASVRVVTARRRSAVALTLRAAAAEPTVEPVSIEICVGSRTIACYAVDRETARALACLLGGPVWLLMVAADAPGCVFGRLWALVPAAAADAAALLADEDGVYALPLAEVRVPDANRVHPGNLVAEVSHLLHHLPPGDSGSE